MGPAAGGCFEHTSNACRFPWTDHLATCLCRCSVLLVQPRSQLSRCVIPDVSTAQQQAARADSRRAADACVTCGTHGWCWGKHDGGTTTGQDRPTAARAGTPAAARACLQVSCYHLGFAVLNSASSSCAHVSLRSVSLCAYAQALLMQGSHCELAS